MKAALKAIDKHNRDLAIIAFAQMDYHIMMNLTPTDSKGKLKKSEADNIKNEAQRLKSALTDPSFAEKEMGTQKQKQQLEKDYHKYKGLTAKEFIAKLQNNKDGANAL